MMNGRHAVWLGATAVVAFGCTLDIGDKHRCDSAEDCLLGRICLAGTCAWRPGPDASVDGVPTRNYLANRMFVTSQKFPPIFTSLQAADDDCNAAARAVGMDGVYAAWLS